MGEPAKPSDKGQSAQEGEPGKGATEMIKRGNCGDTANVAANGALGPVTAQRRWEQKADSAAE